MSQTQVPARTVRLERNGVEIAEVNNLSGPGFSLATEDSTALNESWDSVVPTLLSGGEVTFDLGFLVRDNTHGFGVITTGGLGDDLTNRTLQTFTLYVPGTTAGDMLVAWGFSAYVVNLVPSYSNPGKVTASCTLRIVGQPTLS